MKNIILVLALLFTANSPALAHHGANSASSKTKSLFEKQYKYRINTTEGHVGHFYVKRARASRKGNEKLRIEHTIHLESDVVKKFNVKYSDKTSLLSYNYDMDGYTYMFNFYINKNLLTESNPGAMTIFNKADNTFTVSNVTLEPLDETEEGGKDTGHDDGDGHSHG